MLDTKHAIEPDECATPDVYEASFIMMTTGLHPTVGQVSKARRALEFRFEPSTEVLEAMRAYALGGQVPAKRLSQFVRRNFELIRSFDWQAAR